ncbi:uncharacterized [Tachysurus ichikawai]
MRRRAPSREHRPWSPEKTNCADNRDSSTQHAVHRHTGHTGGLLHRGQHKTVVTNRLAAGLESRDNRERL